MSRTTCFCTALLASGIMLSGGWLPAAGKKAVSRTDPGLAVAEKVLRAEVAGQVNRREQLAGALKNLSDSPSIRWQAGYVRDGKSWRSYDEFSQSAPAPQVRTEYVSRRRDAARTLAGQMDLANWCKKQGLPDEERAHLWAALEWASGTARPPIFGRLGLLPIGNQWLSRADLTQWREFNQSVLKSLKDWGGRLERLARQLEGSVRERESALVSLSQLTEPAAISAIEYVLCSNDATAEPGIATLARMPEFEATIALAQQAVYSKWPRIRTKAAEALKTRPFDDFVPGLIASTASAASATGSNGIYYVADEWATGIGTGVFVLLHSYLVARETDDQFQVGVLQAVDYRISDWLQDKHVHFVQDGHSDFEVGGQELRFGLAARSLDLNREHADRENQLARFVAEQNDRTHELNLRIINVLATVSGQEPVADLKSWWQWWENCIDTARMGDKPTVVVVSESEYGDPTTRFLGNRYSCFGAGTTVWTDQGRKTIEEIQVGDRVIAKNVESGELAYKPVLKTTVRPPKELTTLRLADETIVCTGGHRFWNSGLGWIKARDLESQTLLHTVTGNTPVWSAKKGETAETYNLVVADFHTYFVGQTGLLCQDLLLPQRTNRILPGLSKNVAAVANR